MSRTVERSRVEQARADRAAISMLMFGLLVGKCVSHMHTL